MEHVVPQNVTLKIRTEKSGRGGKIVTVIFSLPNNPAYFEDLTKTLKNRCGTGGSFKNNQIEIQGDQRTRIKPILEQMGFTLIFAGGSTAK